MSRQQADTLLCRAIRLMRNEEDGKRRREIGYLAENLIGGYKDLNKDAMVVKLDAYDNR